MAKILRFRKDREQAEGQKRLFDPRNVSPTPDLTLKPGSPSDARPVGPGASDAIPIPPDERPGDPSPEAQRRQLRRRRLVLAGLATIFLGGTAATIFGERGYLDALARKHQIADLQAAVDAQQERVHALKREVARLEDDPGAIERIAREKLGYARKGEITIVLPPDPEGTRLEGRAGSAMIPADSAAH
jgi:cell division protein FtsB